MKGVTSEVIAEVRMRASILEVISETVVLKRAGKEYKGLCPFHGEKSPSFHVNPEKGIYKCFGCNEGGDVFAFVQKIKGLDFLDTVRELAHKYGVQLVESEEQRKEYDRRSQILMLYQQAAEYYARLLRDPHEGAVARKYLTDRGITEDTMERFKLGYAPNAWDGLLSYLTEKTRVSPATLEEAGLVRHRAESSGHYDLFRNRLMIPICDSEGRVIAFGGRTMGDDQVKYLNSPETPIYHKGLHLFGFNLAKEAIKAKDAVIVVEGYFDAITPHQYGFTNTVATLGTALTEQQAKLLVRYTENKRVFLSFDADAAGARAVVSGGETLTKIAEGIGIDLRVLQVPGGKDPDECLRGADGVAAFQGAIDRALPLIDYQLDRAVAQVPLDTSSGRIEAAGRVVPILAQIKNAVGRGEYVRNWSMKLRLSEENLLSDISRYRRENRLDVQRPGAGFGGGYQQGGYSRYQQDRPNFSGGQARSYQSDGGGQAGARPVPQSGGQYQQGGQGFTPGPQQGFQPGFQQGAGRSQGGAGGFKGSGNFKKGGKNQKPTIADEEGLPMPFGIQGAHVSRRAPVSGSLEAERSLLALYLTSHEDHQVVSARLADETLLNEAHQRIKEGLEGIGTSFHTMEDLQNNLLGRMGPYEDSAKALIEVIYKAEEFRKQKPPVQIVLKESRARILKERISFLKTELRRRLDTSQEDSEVTALQSRIMELNQLDTKVLPQAESLEDIEELKRRIDLVASE